MKYIELFRNKLNCHNEREVFHYLLCTLKDTIKGWDYFVDWAKIMSNVSQVEIPLNMLNYLIGKENIVDEFKRLLREYPEILSAIPILLACREEDFTILEPTEDNIFHLKTYSLKKRKHLTEQELESIAEFVGKSGILSLFQDRKIKNVVDYVMGIEVGLDSNARKNRCGDSMEFITELYVKKVCEKNGFTYIKQATAEKIKSELGYTVCVDKNNRRFDFAVDNGKKLYLIETNFYNGGGSKLKATAGEYKSLFEFIKAGNPEHGFIWVTDGKGWNTARNPLQETFHHIDYVLNLDMLEKGILGDILEMSL